MSKVASLDLFGPFLTIVSPLSDYTRLFYKATTVGNLVRGTLREASA